MISGNLNQTVTLNIATKPMTEQYIIGAMLKEMIEQDTDIEVKITQGVGGGTSNIQPGMVSGEFDLYPEYTSTGWNTVLKHEGFYNETMYEQLVKEYQEKYHDATHNCIAYIVGTQKRANDNGEPSGTAGLPMLDVLEKINLLISLLLLQDILAGLN